MSVHSLGPRLVARPPERICSKLVVQVPGVRNQPHLVLSGQARSVRGLPAKSGLRQHQGSIANPCVSSSARNLFFHIFFLWISPPPVGIQWGESVACGSMGQPPMRPMFTIHAGEYLVGLHLQQRLGLNVWIPAKDTGIDLLVTGARSRCKRNTGRTSCRGNPPCCGIRSAA